MEFSSRRLKRSLFRSHSSSSREVPSYRSERAPQTSCAVVKPVVDLQPHTAGVPVLKRFPKRGNRGMIMNSNQNMGLNCGRIISNLLCPSRLSARLCFLTISTRLLLLRLLRLALSNRTNESLNLFLLICYFGLLFFILLL